MVHLVRCQESRSLAFLKAILVTSLQQTVGVLFLILNSSIVPCHVALEWCVFGPL